MIKVLEKNIADKIAAGEVIERPISIVKELVENAIDAGANSIVVEIKNGGKSYIRITDNGCGIENDQVETAFLRHATSKIVSAADLDSIETLGFRGEALASIGAVTHTELITKTKDNTIGTKLLIHGGTVIQNQGIGCPTGTTIVVTDLFYNTPARLKFLKSDSAESSLIIDFISQMALAYKDIKFRFINNDDIVFSTMGNGNRFNTILSVYKQKELENLVPVSYNEGDNSLEGYISTPAFSKTTKRSQIFFVNGRVVNSKILEKAVIEGYKERLFDGRHPITFLFLHTSPYDLDVNIHPNKKEVRFDKENDIIDFVSKGIKEALGTKEAVIEIKDIFREKTIEMKPEEKQGNIKELLSTKRERDVILPPKVSDDTSVVKDSTISYQLPQKVTIDKPLLTPFDFDDITITGSIFGTYITATDEKNFYLIDQHAAHERIFYEKLVTEYENSTKARQPILIPIIMEVSLSVKENSFSWLNSLNNMGYTIEDFGQNSYIIKEIPTYMDISEAEEFAKTFVEEINENTDLKNHVIINKLITKSCKSAVKAHDYLSMEEINALIKDLSKCVNPFSCPHGRPTFIKLSNYEIEKMFKRV
ncbi:MAG: DNA mismatch repair endonuclease MutL [Anaerovoracaceae bacterium]